MTKHFPAGNLVHLDTLFADAADIPFDPENVKITIEDPDGEVTTYVYGQDAELIKDSTGAYHIDVDTTNKPGLWEYRWYSTGDEPISSKNLNFIVGRNHPIEEEL